MSVYFGIAVFVVCVVCVTGYALPPGGCPTVIPNVYAPVCGSDGRVYGNRFELAAVACQTKTELTVVPNSDCPDFPHRHVGGTKRDCPTYIPNIMDPVCGSDGRIYGNTYEMAAIACEKGVQITEADPSTCQNGPRSREIKTKRDCPTSIPNIMDPTCGSDGRIYGNKWEMAAIACEKGVQITEADPSTCQNGPRRSEQCPTSIPNLYDPTCGSDGRVYGNRHEMAAIACQRGVQITVADPSTCENFPRPQGQSGNLDGVKG